MSDYTFISSNKEFKINLTRRKLNMIPESKNILFDELQNNKRYVLQSQVSHNTFESFLNYWAKDEQLQITADNFFEFYQLDDEFGLLIDLINQPQYSQFNDLGVLIKSKDDTNFDKSYIEKKVALDLNNYLINSASHLKQVPINSLYNIFNHPERNLINHDLAYRFIIDSANEGDECFYILLESLDSDKMKSQENRRDSIVNYRKHQKFAPLNSEKYIVDLEMKLVVNQEHLEKAKQTIKNLNEDKEDLSNKLKQSSESFNQTIKKLKEDKEDLSNKLKQSSESFNQTIKKLKEDKEELSSKINQSSESNNHSYYRVFPSSPKSDSNSTTDNSSNNHSYYRTLPNSPKSSNTSSATTSDNNNHSYYRKLPSSSSSSTSLMEQIISKANSGDMNSQYQAGLSYVKGYNGFPTDLSKAISFLRPAADRFHPEAANLLAKVLANTNNYFEAVKYFEIAVKFNMEESLVLYGEMLCTGDHVNIDQRRGVELLQKAMRMINDAKSLLIIGYRFYKIHTNALLIDARRCFEKGARLNHAHSIFNYAYMLERGEGGDRDIKKAFELYVKAAEMNSIPALIHLGEIFEYGRYSNSPDFNKALRFYNSAKELGSSEAVEAINRVETKKRRNEFTGFTGLNERDLLIGMMLRDLLNL